MKYLEDPALAALSSQLTTTSPEASVHARIELYTTKKTNKDKKLYRSIDHHWEDEIAFKSASPSHPSAATVLDSPFGPLDEPHARHTFCTLIATLNCAFPDHDFSDVSPDQFTRESNGGAPILSALSNALTGPSGLSGGALSSSNPHLSSRSFAAFPANYAPPATSASSPSGSPITSLLHQIHHTSPAALSSHPALFRTLNDALSIGDGECEVYSYAPDIYSDPHGSLDDDDETDSMASSDEDEEGGWVWDDYDDADDGLPSSLTGSGYVNGSEGGGKKVDPWEMSGSPDRDVVFSFDDDEYDGPTAKARKSKRASSASQYYPASSSPPSSSALKARSSLPSPSSARAQAMPPPSSSRYDSYDSYESQSQRGRGGRPRRRKGSLLWSSHWFFYHKKEKKVLFVSLWARQREWAASSFSSAKLTSSELKRQEMEYQEFEEGEGDGEAFGGWEGAEGAGMRAFESALEGRGASRTTRSTATKGAMGPPSMPVSVSAPRMPPGI